MFSLKKILTFIATFQPLLGSEEHFFARHVNPLTLTPDASQLLAVNSAEGRLSVFRIGPQATDHPVLTAEIPVGLLPVSVRMRTPDEAWVINELSDSISIVSLSRRVTLATIPTGDEPADVAFAAGKAFVTCSRDNSIEVFDPRTRTKLATIPLQGIFPRAIIASADRTLLHTIFLHTSNGTTILPRHQAPPQKIPESFRPELPPPPRVGQIVPTDHESIAYEVLDHDLATIDAQTHAVVTYQGKLGTNMLSLASLPNGDLLIGNSESRNLIALEPELNGRFAFTRLAQLSGGEVTQSHLNPDPDLTFPEITPNDSALSQIFAILPESNSQAWLASFGSDRLARFNLNTREVSALIDLRQGDQSVRGPRGLAAHPSLPRLFVLNRLSHTLSSIDTEKLTLFSEIPLSSHSDLEPSLKRARGHLFDARLSGNGSVSCASCHIDLERDGMAWDLGDPAGSMLSIPGALLSLHSPDSIIERAIHPMKGPMITQTLIGLADQTKLHWRGDKPSIQSFNSTFPKLLAAPLLPADEMDQVAAYLLNLRHHPNPHLQLDRNLPAEVAGGNPSDGIAVFTLFDNHCSACHHLPSGTSNNLDIPSTFGSSQPLKDAPLRTTYHRNFFNPTPGQSSLSGFGLGSDGSHHELPISHPYSLHILDDIDRPLATREKEKRDLTAFILSFDTGTAPAIGHSITITAEDGTPPDLLAELFTLQAQAELEELSGVGLIARGIYQGQSRSFQYLPATRSYLADHSQEASLSPSQLSISQLIDSLLPGDALTFTGVPFGMTPYYSIDRNRDGTPDNSLAPPSLSLGQNRLLTWPANRNGWHPEVSTDFQEWAPVLRPAEEENSLFRLSPEADSPQSFYRLRRTW